MNQLFKVNDVIICHSKCQMQDGDYVTTVGKSYTIISINKYDYQFAIIDDHDIIHWFSDNFERWFYNKSQTRKYKLLKLNEY